MFHEVDVAVQSWLLSGLPQEVLVSFDVPDQSWAARERKKPTINSFLCAVRQDQQGKAANWVGVRARDGRVVGRQPPARHYQVCYLITAWANDPAAEHRLLGAALATLSMQDTIPAPYLTGSLLEAEHPVPVFVANPEYPTTPPEIWNALGTPPRSAFDLVATVPLVPPLFTDLAPPPSRLELDAEGRRRTKAPLDDGETVTSEHRSEAYS